MRADGGGRVPPRSSRRQAAAAVRGPGVRAGGAPHGPPAGPPPAAAAVARRLGRAGDREFDGDATSHHHGGGPDDAGDGRPPRLVRRQHAAVGQHDARLAPPQLQRLVHLLARQSPQDGLDAAQPERAVGGQRPLGVLPALVPARHRRRLHAQVQEGRRRVDPEGHPQEVQREAVAAAVLARRLHEGVAAPGVLLATPLPEGEEPPVGHLDDRPAQGLAEGRLPRVGSSRRRRHRRAPDVAF